MGIPGPGAAEWGFALLLWAALAVVVGELVRVLAARYVHLWRTPEPIERAVLDFFLGGAVVYLVAAVPWDAFVAPVVYLLPVAAAVGLVLLARRAVQRGSGAEGLLAALKPLGRPAYWLVLASALGLFAVEIAVASPVATGNTFDSSLLTTYTSLLLQHHTTPTSFSPYAATGILYPQGTTVWLGWAQVVFALPAARTPLLVTPLFFALAPMAGFVFGRRQFGSERAGLAVALMMAWVGPGTRAIVYGSNDFVFAFPLVLLLAGQATMWLRAPVPPAVDAVGFGLLLGYSAAMNPVGAEWLLPTLLIAPLLVRPKYAGSPGRWLATWLAAAAASLVAILPSLYVLARGQSSPGFVPGATAAAPGTASGITESQFFGFLDPFLFGSSNTELSPLAALRIELAILLVLGLAILLLVGRDSVLGRYLERFRPFVAGAAAAILLLLAILWTANSGFAPAVAFTHISSASELSTWLFALYGVIAAVPLALFLERFAGWLHRSSAATAEPTSAATRSRTLAPARPSVLRTVAPIVAALVVVVPGVVLTTTQLPASLSGVYDDFGNVTGADFDLLAFAGSHLPSGARVLVAPGSAGQFLPGYCTNLRLLYPMVPGFRTVNSSYELLVEDLPNGTMDARDVQAISALGVQYVVVTGANTILWRPFSPVPFLADPENYTSLFHEGDAYLFERTG